MPARTPLIRQRWLTEQTAGEQVGRGTPTRCQMIGRPRLAYQVMVGIAGVVLVGVGAGAVVVLVLAGAVVVAVAEAVGVAVVVVGVGVGESVVAVVVGATTAAGSVVALAVGVASSLVGAVAPGVAPEVSVALGVGDAVAVLAALSVGAGAGGEVDDDIVDDGGAGASTGPMSCTSASRTTCCSTSRGWNGVATPHVPVLPCIQGSAEQMSWPALRSKSSMKSVPACSAPVRIASASARLRAYARGIWSAGSRSSSHHPEAG